MRNQSLFQINILKKSLTSFLYDGPEVSKFCLKWLCFPSSIFTFLQIIVLSFKGFCFPEIFLLCFKYFCFPSKFIQIFFPFLQTFLIAFIQIYFYFPSNILLASCIFFLLSFKYFCFPLIFIQIFFNFP